MKNHCDYDCNDCHVVSCGVYQGYQTLEEKITIDENESEFEKKRLKKLIVDKGIVEAVIEDACAIEVATLNNKNNKFAITIAVAKDGSKLIYASDRLKNDLSVVTIAVSNYPFAYNIASNELQKNKKIAILAMLGDKRVYKDLDESLKNDPDILFLKNCE